MQGITLREYQSRGVSDIRQAYIQGYRAPLYVLATGGGKTVTFVWIAQNAAARGKKVLILVHRIELLRQSSKTLGSFGVPHGIINPKYTPNYAASVQVASVQTLVGRKEKIPFVPDLIIIDEAHHGTAGSWRQICDYYAKARLLGVTATPVRGDGQGLGADAGGIFDALVLGPSTRELMDMGNLVEPIVYAPSKTLDLSSVKIRMGDYDKKELAKAVDKPTVTGDAVAHYTKLCPRVPAVAFCVSVSHAEHVATEFRDAGYVAYSVDGSMDDDTRSRILAGLGNGSVHVVTSCDLISEGTDIPAIGCAILLRPTKSEGLYLQQVGRALRPYAGKTTTIILDHVGNTLLHGLPDQHRDWSLDGNKKKKKKGEQEKSLAVAQCPACYAIHAPAPACPVCGHVVPAPTAKKRDLKHKDGELVQITKQQAEIAYKQKRVEVGKAQTLEQLEVIAKARGYKPGWAEHVFEAKQKKQTKQTAAL